MWKRIVNSSLIMVVLLPVIGYVLGQGFVWGVVCNKKKADAEKACDSGYASSTYCYKRTAGRSECETEPGADGKENQGEKWRQACLDGGVNTDHCVTEGTNCLRKYECFWWGYGIGEGCKALSEWTPEAWWQTPKTSSPTCTPET